jgi:mono/diheme cytochrome c family protein
MKKLLIIALAVSALCVLLAGPSFADEAKKDEAKKAAIPIGQKAFTEAKCQMCHTVYSAGIGEPPAKDAKEEEEEASGPPDLSLAGTGRTAEWLSLFLQKKEALNEKKHMMKFKGTDEDLTALVGWILTLKAPEVEAAPAKTGKVEKKATEAGAEKATEGEASEKGHDCGHDHGDTADKDADAEVKKGE